MRKLLLTLLLLLTMVVKCSGQVPTYIDNALFKTTFHTQDPLSGEIETHWGTAFCAPGKPHLVLTAGHTIGGDTTLTDLNGDEHEFVVLKRDEKADISVLLLKDDYCTTNPIEWGPTGRKRDRAWTYGFGNGFKEPITAEGFIASNPGLAEEAVPNGQVAQLNALGGHSGSPVFDAKNRVIGMLVGGFKALDEMDVIIPVEVLKKFLPR